MSNFCHLQMQLGFVFIAAPSPQFSDMAAARLASCCSRVTSLSLAGCWRLTDEGLEHLVALTRLTSLDLTNCNPGPGEGAVFRS